MSRMGQGEIMPVIRPSRHYVAMLDIAAIVTKWKELTIGERTALGEIGAITIEQQKLDWKDEHK